MGYRTFHLNDIYIVLNDLNTISLKILKACLSFLPDLK